jgi:hypothetical protein
MRTQRKVHAVPVPCEGPWYVDRLIAGILVFVRCSHCGDERLIIRHPAAE